jgi:hypothetical protein
MWMIGELFRLIEKVVIGFLVALTLAALWAAASEHSFKFDLRNTSLIVGAFAILMGAIGRGSNFDRGMDFGVTQAAWGRIPGLSTIKRTGEDPTLSPGAVLVLTGAALIAFAVAAL